jgi:hypothetical protein
MRPSSSSIASISSSQAGFFASGAIDSPLDAVGHSDLKVPKIAGGATAEPPADVEDSEDENNPRTGAKIEAAALRTELDVPAATGAPDAAEDTAIGAGFSTKERPANPPIL